MGQVNRRVYRGVHHDFEPARDAVNNIRVDLVPPSLPATPASKGVGLLLDSEPSVAAPHRGPDETMTMADSPNTITRENGALSEVD